MNGPRTNQIARRRALPGAASSSTRLPGIHRPERPCNAFVNRRRATVRGHEQRQIAGHVVSHEEARLDEQRHPIQGSQGVGGGAVHPADSGGTNAAQGRLVRALLATARLRSADGHQAARLFTEAIPAERLAVKQNALPGDGNTNASIEPGDGNTKRPMLPGDGSIRAVSGALMLPGDGNYLDVAISRGFSLKGEFRAESARGKILRIVASTEYRARRSENAVGDQES